MKNPQFKLKYNDNSNSIFDKKNIYVIFPMISNIEHF